LKDNAVVLFTRIPVPGKTKTRLQPLLTGEECCALHRALLRDIFNALNVKDAAYDILVYYVPEGDLTELAKLLPDDCEFIPQRGVGIGERMHNAVAETFARGYRRCLVVGSDIPLLDSRIVIEAFNLLSNNDMVLNPTEDGGYYLIGFTEPCDKVFDIEGYGTSTVFEKTVSAVEEAGKTCAIGTRLLDIDEPDDLHRLAELLKQDDPDICPETRKALKELRNLQ